MKYHTYFNVIFLNWWIGPGQDKLTESVRCICKLCEYIERSFVGHLLCPWPTVVKSNYKILPSISGNSSLPMEVKNIHIPTLARPNHFSSYYSYCPRGLKNFVKM